MNLDAPLQHTNTSAFFHFPCHRHTFAYSHFFKACVPPKPMFLCLSRQAQPVSVQDSVTAFHTHTQSALELHCKPLSWENEKKAHSKQWKQHGTSKWNCKASIQPHKDGKLVETLNISALRTVPLQWVTKSILLWPAGKNYRYNGQFRWYNNCNMSRVCRRQIEMNRSVTGILKRKHFESVSWCTSF